MITSRRIAKPPPCTKATLAITRRRNFLANNPALRGNFRGLNDFFDDITKGALPPDGGVFYLRGGYINIAGDKPYIRPGAPGEEAQLIVERMRGDDDHPGYSDHQISEAMTARAINAIASKPDIWIRSIIVIA